MKEFADDARVIMCDYDRPKDFPPVPVMRAIVNRQGLTLLGFRQDRTRRGFHLVAWFRESFTKMERVCLQLLFGSDPNREGLNFKRARSLNRYPSRAWERRWNLLFERKL